MEANELLTKADIPRIVDQVVAKLAKLISDQQVQQKKPLPALVSGKWIVDNQIAGIGSTSTLYNRVNQMLNDPECDASKIIYGDKGSRQYDPQALLEWTKKYKKLKEDEQVLDPRLKLRG